MKSFKLLGLSLAMLLFATGSFGQVWKQYADKANFFLEKKEFDKAIEFSIKTREALQKDSLGTGSYATSCNNLGILYQKMGQYEQAELVYLEAKQTWENVVGKNNPDYATSCNNLAALYKYGGQYRKAEELYLEAKQILESAFGRNHLDYATSCNNLAALYSKMGKYEKAETLYIEAKQIREKALGKYHPGYATSCNNLAALYKDIGLYEQAEPLYIEAKQIRETALGKDDPDYANSCDNLGDLWGSIVRQSHYTLRPNKYGIKCLEMTIPTMLLPAITWLFFIVI